MADVQRWEYYVETTGTAFRGLKDPELDEILNILGDEGWEVFIVEQITNSPKIRIVAKRALLSRSRRR